MNIKTAFLAFLGGVSSPLWLNICVAQEGVRWEPLSLQAAQQRAAQTRRLVLVHFWSPNCGPCQKMERLVFSRPDVAAAVEASYVPVKINADQFPYTARQFGITALPTDLILSPEGQVIRRFQGAVPAEQYIAQLQRVAMEMQVAGVGSPVGPTSAGGPPSGGNPPIAGSRQIPPGQPIPGGPPITGGQSIPGSAPITGGQPFPAGPPIPGGSPIPGGQSIPEGQSIAGPPSQPAWPSSWRTPASALPETPTTPSSSGYQNTPVVAPVGGRYAGVPSGNPLPPDTPSNAPPGSDRYAGIASGVPSPNVSRPTSGSSYGGGNPLGSGPGSAENSPLPLADRTMGSPPGGSPSVASSSLPLSSPNPSGATQGDVAGKPSAPEVSAEQRGPDTTLQGTTGTVRSEAPPLGSRSSSGGSGSTVTDSPGGPSGTPVAADWPPGLPPLGLEGYCPVSLVEKRRWVLGTHPWGVIHEGRTYMCAGPEEQKKFLANPERYAPVLSGQDVVLATERGQQVPGRREYGVFYRGRVYLFAEPATLDAFRKNPRRYIDAISSPSPSPPETAARR